jgi:hypothetical protein
MSPKPPSTKAALHVLAALRVSAQRGGRYRSARGVMRLAEPHPFRDSRQNLIIASDMACPIADPFPDDVAGLLRRWHMSASAWIIPRAFSMSTQHGRAPAATPRLMISFRPWASSTPRASRDHAVRVGAESVNCLWATALRERSWSGCTAKRRPMSHEAQGYRAQVGRRETFDGLLRAFGVVTRRAPRCARDA